MVFFGLFSLVPTYPDVVERLSSGGGHGDVYGDSGADLLGNDLPRRCRVSTVSQLADSSFFLQSPHTPEWLNLYLCGAGMEMYTETLSHSFVGSTFPQTAE